MPTASQWRLISLTALVVVVFVIVFQNLHRVETHILFVSVRMPMVVTLLLAMAAGFVVGRYLTGRKR